MSTVTLSPSTTYASANGKPVRRNRRTFKLSGTPGRGALGHDVERPLNLVGEVETEARELRLVPVARRGQIRDRSCVEDDPHPLPPAPALGDPRPDRVPVLDWRARLDLPRAALDLSCPDFHGVGIRRVVQAGEELVSESRALACGKGEAVENTSCSASDMTQL